MSNKDETAKKVTRILVLKDQKNRVSNMIATIDVYKKTCDEEGGKATIDELKKTLLAIFTEYKSEQRLIEKDL